ncbi:MAG: hypothetical protein IKP65_08030 [Alphaproteobacteria bacterium]|nr:hypothetical protein [Alphaproteobacteria bacterium]
MNKIRIGKVAITHEGIYDDKKTYEVNTCVSYNGSTYISLKQVKNVIPSNDGVYWRLMASKGDKGEKGNDGSVSFNSLTESQKKQLKGEKGNDGYYFIPEMDE